MDIFTFGLLLLPGKLTDMINYPVKITDDNAQRQFLLVRLFLRLLQLVLVIMFVGLQYALLTLARNSKMTMGALIFILLTIVFLPIVIHLYLAIRAK